MVNSGGYFPIPEATRLISTTVHVPFLYLCSSAYVPQIRVLDFRSEGWWLEAQAGIGWFQKISIPIPRAASRNSEGEGGVKSTGIPRTWGGSLDWNSEGMGGFSGE